MQKLRRECVGRQMHLETMIRRMEEILQVAHTWSSAPWHRLAQPSSARTPVAAAAPASLASKTELPKSPPSIPDPEPNSQPSIPDPTPNSQPSIPDTANAGQQQQSAEVKQGRSKSIMQAGANFDSFLNDGPVSRGAPVHLSGDKTTKEPVEKTTAEPVAKATVAASSGAARQVVHNVALGLGRGMLRYAGLGLGRGMLRYAGLGRTRLVVWSGLGRAGLGWAGLGWAGLGAVLA